MPIPVVDSKVKRNLKMNSIDGAFASISDHLTNPFLGLFALSLGATPSQIGMLNAFPSFLGNILQIPYGILANRIKNRMILITIGALSNRLCWVLIAFIPFLVRAELAVPAVIILATLRVIGANVGVPAWTAIQAEVVPKQVRGRYYANRNIIISSSGLLATVAAGRILALSYPVNYQILFVLAFIMGMFSLIAFLQIQVKPNSKPQSAKPREKRRFRPSQIAGLIKANSNFSYYCFAAFIWSVGVNLISPLVSVYFIQDLQGTAEYWAYVQAASTVATILCQRYWGILTDKFGQKNIMVKAGIGAVVIPFLWFIAPNPLSGIVINLWNGFVWGGFNLAAFNFLLEITPDDSRSMYAGVYNSLMGIAVAGGTLTGGFLAEVIGLKYLFLISFVGRGLGLWLISRVNADTNIPMRFKDLRYPLIQSRG